MPTVSASIDLDVSPDEVWALMCDPSRYPEWVDATERMIHVDDREFGVGYTYREYGGVKPFLSESDWEVTELEPMTHQHHEGDDGKMRLPLDVDLEAVGDGTRLTLTISMQPRWYMAPLNAVLWPLMMRKRSQAVMDGTVANVKRILEPAAA